MKLKVRVVYVEGENLEDLQKKVNEEIEALEVNVNYNILEVKTIDKTVAQITYGEMLTPEPVILNESEEVKEEIKED